MKRIMVLLFLCVFVAGCENNQSEKNNDGQANAPGLVVENLEEDPVDNTPVVDEAEDTPSEAGGVSAYEGLVGQALLDRIEPTMAESLFIEGVTKGQGMTVENKTYILGENFRYETGDGEDTQVMIYQAEEGITYSYSENESVGFIFYDDAEDDYELEDEDDYFDLEGGILLTAEIRTLNGEDVLYMESQTSTGEGVWMTKQWLHLKYLQPYKYESYYNDVLEASYEALVMTENFRVEADLFQPPDHIEFEDLDGMFDFELP